MIDKITNWMHSFGLSADSVMVGVIIITVVILLAYLSREDN